MTFTRCLSSSYDTHTTIFPAADGTVTLATAERSFLPMTSTCRWCNRVGRSFASAHREWSTERMSDVALLLSTQYSAISPPDADGVSTTRVDATDIDSRAGVPPIGAN
jgi:hypothetical protein